MGVPRATEWTIRDLLQEELRKRGVTVVPEVSFDTPFGIRLNGVCAPRSGYRSIRLRGKASREKRELKTILTLYTN